LIKGVKAHFFPDVRTRGLPCAFHRMVDPAGNPGVGVDIFYNRLTGQPSTTAPLFS